jgi:hypothetical protein
MKQSVEDASRISRLTSAGLYAGQQRLDQSEFLI